MLLTKSKYRLMHQCHKLLWLETHQPELKAPASASESHREAGIQLGEMARQYFGPYTDVTFRKPDGTLDLNAMIAATRECMANGTEIICEASFRAGDLFCSVDLLRRQDGGWAIYEVKSGTAIKPVHLVDIAFQKYVLDQCGVNVTGTYLIHRNEGYIRGETLEIREMFTVTDVAEKIQIAYDQIPETIAQAESVSPLESSPCIPLGPHCRKPIECPYWAHCSAHLPEPSVFDLYNMNFKHKLNYYDAGCISFQDLENPPKLKKTPELTVIQKMQVDHYLHPQPDHIDRDALRVFLKDVQPPLYFLDFESMQVPVPQCPGDKPYAQIPFQYSLHYIEEPGGEIKHKEFLAVSGQDPRRALAEQLCRDIPRDVCVTAYNKKFECGRLMELAEQFPDLGDHLLNIHGHIVDLLEPFQNGHYYNRAMGSSFSIKSVLPALYPNDPELDYHKLDQVHNGTEAMNIFPMLKDMSPEEREKARTALLKYCELDTLAMVKVWQALTRAAEQTE